MRGQKVWLTGVGGPLALELCGKRRRAWDRSEISAKLQIISFFPTSG
jgi:hypothetical protein